MSEKKPKKKPTKPKAKPKAVKPGDPGYPTELAKLFRIG